MGVSADPVDRQKEFDSLNGLGFPLVSDSDRSIAKQFGTKRFGPIPFGRQTFVIDEDGKVAFHTVDIVRTATDGVWITGLPERVRVITVGQGFVREGDRVEAHAEDRGA